jgi:hypothetical protein
VVLDASRRGQQVPRLAAWSLGAGICATVGVNLAHGVGHGPVGALVSAWPALALVGSFELLMMLVQTGRSARSDHAVSELRYQAAPPLTQDAPLGLPVAPAWSRPSTPGTRRGTASVPSPANSTSTVAESSASSTRQLDSVTSV